MARNTAFDKEKSLEKVSILFWQKGYESTSINDIVDLLKINRSSLYNSLGDKDTLYEYALNWYINKSIIVSKAKEVENGLEFINDILTQITEEAKQKKSFGCMIINASQEYVVMNSKFKKTIHHYQSQVIELIKQAVEVGQEDGDIKHKKDAKELAEYIYTIVVGLYAQIRAGKTYDELKSIRKELIKSIKVK